MIVSPHNKQLYDSKKFDIYENFFAIHFSDIKIAKRKEKIDDYSNKLNIKYELQLLSIFFRDPSTITKNDSKIYEIVYGHFFDNEDYFIYKNVYNDSISQYKIKTTKASSLYYNDDKNIIASRSLSNIKAQAILLDRKLSKEQAKDSSGKTIDFIYLQDNETLVIESNDYLIDFEYYNNILKINTNDNNVIIFKENRQKIY